MAAMFDVDARSLILTFVINYRNFIKPLVTIRSLISGNPFKNCKQKHPIDENWLLFLRRIYLPIMVI